MHHQQSEEEHSTATVLPECAAETVQHPSSPGWHQPQLDGLRAIAILLVLWSHWMPAEWQFGLPLGHFGVQLFFVLSGFLVTNILLRSTSAEAHRQGHVLRAFFVRRVLRIFPAYFSLLLGLWIYDVSHARRDIVWHLFFISNIRIFYYADFNTLLAHFWTVCVEEQFYLIWPWIILASSRLVAIRVMLTMIVASPLFRVLMLARFPQLPATVLLPGVMDAFAAGAIVAASQASPSLARCYRLLQVQICLPAFVALQTLAANFPVSPAAEAVRQTTMVLVFALVVSETATGIRGWTGKLLESRIATYIGKVSYGMYLVHNFIPHALESLLRPAGVDWPSFAKGALATQFAILLLATVLMASLSWKLIEHPMLRFKRYFPYRPNE